MTQIQFPQLSGDAQDATGVIVTWFVEDGQRVEADMLLAEVAVDKVDAEVLAPSGGTITLLAAEEAEVAQGSVIATIEE